MGSDTKNRIVTAAAALFHQHGYHATGVSAILEAAGVNSGSLYHFFDTKEDLLEGVVDHHLERLGPTILDPVQAMSPHGPERIEALAEYYRRNLLASGFDRGCPVGALALEIGDHMPGVCSLIDDYFSFWTDRVAQSLDAAADPLPADTDRLGVARLVLAALQGAIMQAKAARSIEPYDATVEQLQFFLEMLTRRPRERPERLTTPKVDEEPPPEDESTDSIDWRTW